MNSWVSIYLVENYAISEVGKAGPMSQIQPTDYLCSTHEFSMIFTFLNGLGERWE